MRSKKILTIALMIGLMTATMSFMVVNNIGEVAFAKTTHNFEEIPQGTPVTTTFKFTNHADKPLILKTVKASCGCTAPTYSKAPILSGDSGEITVKYNAASAGKFKKSITVHTNIEEAPIKLYIEGTVTK